MPSQGTDGPAIAALGRTLASIARSDFRLRDVLQSVVEEAASLHQADVADIALSAACGEAPSLCQADVADLAVRDGSVYRMSAFTGFTREFEALVSSLV